MLGADFVIDSFNQKNIALNTKCAYVTALGISLKVPRTQEVFKDDMTSQDVGEGFLRSFRGPIEAKNSSKTRRAFD
jgi:hypothetical protein